jgi:hypothetical protein
MQKTSEEDLANNPDFVPPVGREEYPEPDTPLTPPALQRPVVESTEPEMNEDTIESLRATLGDSYSDVVSAITEE